MTSRRSINDWQWMATAFMFDAVLLLSSPGHPMPAENRILAVQDVLDEAGFDATATCWVIDESFWPTPCEGLDGEAATEWLRMLIETMPRGQIEDELVHIAVAIRARTERLL